MTSRRCDPIAAKFDDDYTLEKLRTYRENGPGPRTRALVGALLEEDLECMTLLDIGGGGGPVQHEPPRAGVASAQEVEASRAYTEACRNEAPRQGHDARITHFSGDFEAVPHEVEAVLSERGLRRHPHTTTSVWQIAVLERR